MFFKILFFKSLQISQENTCVAIFFNKVTGTKNSNFITKRLQYIYFLWILWVVQKHLFCVKNLWMAGSETPVRFFKNTSFYRISRAAASGSFKFPTCNFIKKGTPAKTFLHNLQNF